MKVLRSHQPVLTRLDYDICSLFSNSAYLKNFQAVTKRREISYISAPFLLNKHGTNSFPLSKSEIEEKNDQKLSLLHVSAHVTQKRDC